MADKSTIVGYRHLLPVDYMRAQTAGEIDLLDGLCHTADADPNDFADNFFIEQPLTPDCTSR